MKNTLYLVLPCYNEREVIPETANILCDVVNNLIKSGKISNKSKICFVDDGSCDSTWDIICNLHAKNSLFTGITLSKNSGHQNALLCGLLSVKEKCDMAISMDADLQDDVLVIENMVDKYLEGCDIVYGVRNDRNTDGFFKRFTAELFYRLMNFLGTKIVFNHADFRLMSRRTIKILEKFEEVNLFLRGIIPLIGFRTDYVYYSRKIRKLGKSKYPFVKMIQFALNGITSFSIIPIRMISFMGIFFLLCSFTMVMYSIYRFISCKTIIGWTSIMASIWGIGGLIFLSIGVVGEYVGKTYMESKRRPRFIIDTNLEESDAENI